MAKRNKTKRKSSPQKRTNPAARTKSRRWRGLRQFILSFAILGAVVGTGLAAFKHNYDISHDLSVIGKGVPAVVQIHDPNCSLCNQLRRNASSAVDQFGDRLLYRIADISTPAGRAMQLRHDVPHVTLLLFDGEGKLRKVLNGVKSDEVLERSFERHLERWG